jgi:hypothetical protein
MSKKSTGQRGSAPTQSAKLSNFAYAIEQEREFQLEYGHLNDMELHQAAFKFEMLGFRLRHMLWNRNERQYNPN